MVYLLIIYSMSISGNFSEKVVGVAKTLPECNNLIVQSKGGMKILPNKYYKCLEVKQ